MVRDIIPFIFWPWFAFSCFVLLRRRVSRGTWRTMGPQETPATIEFPEPPEATMSEPSAVGSPPERPDHEADHPDGAAVAVMAPIDLSPPRARSLADAVEGIVMPCDLAPLMGVGAPDPRVAAFFATGHLPSEVGTAISDELERLGYSVVPVGETVIRAHRGPNTVRAQLRSAELDSESVMRELHPSAPPGSVVVELQLA